jgi:hypothetical protein
MRNAPCSFFGYNIPERHFYEKERNNAEKI